MSNTKINQGTARPARRKLLLLLGVGGVAASTLPAKWIKPVIDSVLLPAHAQTSMCVTDITESGPLVGHFSGAPNCQAVCEAEATAAGAQLCAVTETADPVAGTICNCDLDNP